MSEPTSGRVQAHDVTVRLAVVWGYDVICTCGWEARVQNAIMAEHTRTLHLEDVTTPARTPSGGTT